MRDRHELLQQLVVVDRQVVVDLNRDQSLEVPRGGPETTMTCDEISYSLFLKLHSAASSAASIALSHFFSVWNWVAAA